MFSSILPNRYLPIFKTRNSWKIVLALACAALLAAGCGGGGGGGGGGTTPGPGPVIPTDTTAPAVSISEPADGAAYIVNTPPARVALAYSDAGGVNTQTLSVTFTMNQRTVDLTGFFTKGASSASAESGDLFSRTTVSAYTGAGFTSFTSATVAIPGNPAQCDFRADATAGRLYLFCPSDAASTFKKITVIDGSTGAAAEVATTFPVKALAAASAAGKYYAARADANAVAVYSASGNSFLRQIALGAAPEDISYNAAENRLYVSYTGSNRVDYVNCSTDAVAGGFTMDNPFSEMRAAFSGAGFLLLAQKAGQFWFQTYNGAGALAVDAALGNPGDPLPGDIEWTDAAATDYHYFSDMKEGRNQLFFYDSAQASMSTAALAFSPQGMFADRSGAADALYVISSDGKTVRNHTGASNFSPPAPVVSGEALGGKKYLLENIWQIATQVSGTLTATVRDSAGNTGTKSLTLKFTPESQGPGRAQR